MSVSRVSIPDMSYSLTVRMRARGELGHFVFSLDDCNSAEELRLKVERTVLFRFSRLTAEVYVDSKTEAQLKGQGYRCTVFREGKILDEGVFKILKARHFDTIYDGEDVRAVLDMPLK